LNQIVVRVKHPFGIVLPCVVSDGRTSRRGGCASTFFVRTGLFGIVADSGGFLEVESEPGVGSSLSHRSFIITTYALCGFANFSSIAIQIGGISSLAPSRRGDLARLGLRAMFAGTLANFLTATIAGMLL